MILQPVSLGQSYIVVNKRSLGLRHKSIDNSENIFDDVETLWPRIAGKFFPNSRMVWTKGSPVGEISHKSPLGQLPDGKSKMQKFLHLL